MAKKKEERAVIVEGEITPETVRKVLGVIVIIVIAWLGFQGYNAWQMGEEIPLQEAIKMVKDGSVEEVVDKNTLIVLKEKDGSSSFSQIDPNTSFTELLQRDGVVLSELETNIKPENQNIGMSLLDLASFILMLGIGYGIFTFIKTIQKQSSGGGGLMSFGKSNAAVIIGKRPKVTFKDVAGAKEAKEEISEIVEFLKDPKRFFKMGARIPRGVLLTGEPGTGKTLLARAVAGEAKVPFFHTSGPEFEEMLVGAGAARVRDLFKRAKNLAPSIIFIDEIDAVARRRGMDYKSSHSEQTLNQILVEMDGFEKRDAVIVIAATNRPDVLDKALMRPGRFDRTVTMDLPDVGEREEILNVHAKNKKFAEDVDLKRTAQFTVGYSGADLENVLNESAILAVRGNKNEIEEEDLKEAVMKVAMGARRGSLMMTEDDLKRTAYHEAGHAILGVYMEHADPVTAVTVVPRGQSLGMTVYSAEKDRRGQTKDQLLARITTASGGRIAEEIVFGKGEIGTGAAGDIESVTRIANAMVRSIGMSEKTGFIQLDKDQDFDMFSSKQRVSEKTAEMLDSEVKRIVDEQYQLGVKILKREQKLLDVVAEELMKVETLDRKSFLKLVKEHGTVEVSEKKKEKLLSVMDWIKGKKK